MKLLTKELEKRFKEVGSQENVKDPVVIAKFFNPTGQATWFATEYEPSDKVFFGYVSLFNDPTCNEFGCFTLDELENLKVGFGLGVERDMYCGEQKLSEWKEQMSIA